MLEGLKESVKDLQEDVKDAVAKKELDQEELDKHLESFRLKLLKSNVSLEAAEKLEEAVRSRLQGEKVGRLSVEEEVAEALKQELREGLDDSFSVEDLPETPTVFFIGFNGSGKTTSLAKFARRLEDEGLESVLAAGDTFRAASMEQLEEHGENLGMPVIRHEYESDPAAVAYDAVEKASNEGKAALVDTAGRAHSDRNLMEELQKMIDVNEPDHTFLVVDALAGNDVSKQIEAYEGMFDAVIVSKIDVDDEGGAVVTAGYESGKPVAYLGTGQGLEDLRKFDSDEFVEELLG